MSGAVFRRVVCLVFFLKNTNLFFKIFKIKKIWKILAEYYLGKGGNYALRLILVKMYFFPVLFE
jgi:3-methyladenine DNA glycosylase AlkD